MGGHEVAHEPHTVQPRMSASLRGFPSQTERANTNKKMSRFKWNELNLTYISISYPFCMGLIPRYIYVIFCSAIYSYTNTKCKWWWWVATSAFKSLIKFGGTAFRNFIHFSIMPRPPHAAFDSYASIQRRLLTLSGPSHVAITADKKKISLSFSWPIFIVFDYLVPSPSASIRKKNWEWICL